MILGAWGGGASDDRRDQSERSAHARHTLSVTRYSADSGLSAPASYAHRESRCVALKPFR